MEGGVLKRMAIKKLINYPNKIDYSEYKKDSSNIAKYGLPTDIKFCIKKIYN